MTEQLGSRALRSVVMAPGVLLLHLKGVLTWMHRNKGRGLFKAKISL